MSIEILGNGIVLVARLTDDGVWRTSINPGDTERAAEFLSEGELQQVTTAWTPGAIAAWKAEVAANNERLEHLYGSQPPAVDEIAELRAELADLKAELVAMKGQMTEITAPMVKARV